MSNIAGKAYAMNVITPIPRCRVGLSRFIFWLAGTRLFASKLRGLQTLSLIHYARWAILRRRDFPRLDASQPAEDLRYAYLFFFSNFNGSWAQYVDSFSAAIPHGLNLLWHGNVKYPKSVPLEPFHDYITANQIFTDYYYSAYPMASANDVKAGSRVRSALLRFVEATRGVSAEEFRARYEGLLLELQGDLGAMAPTPIVSLSADAVERRRAAREGALAAGARHA
jgi:hypothetical protein